MRLLILVLLVNLQSVNIDGGAANNKSDEVHEHTFTAFIESRPDNVNDAADNIRNVAKDNLEHHDEKGIEHELIKPLKKHDEETRINDVIKVTKDRELHPVSSDLNIEPVTNKKRKHNANDKNDIKVAEEDASNNVEIDVNSTISTESSDTETETSSPSVLTFRKCCQAKHVLYLDQLTAPYCEPLHGLELDQLSIPTVDNRQVTWTAEVFGIPTCFNSSLKIVEDFYVNESGIIVNNVQSDLSLENTEYCIDFGIEDGSFIRHIALVCQGFEEICKKESCVNLCCNNEEPCISPEGEFFETHIGRPFQLDCESSPVNISINEEGMLFHEEQLHPEEYCIDPGGSIKNEFIEGRVCEDRKNDNYYKKINSYLLTVLLLISVVSLLVSFLLHCMVPELRHSMFGWMKMSHLLSMFWSYTILFIIYIGGLDLVFQRPLACKLLGFMFQYFILASFFWVNVMSFDIWRTFRHMRGYGSMVNRMLGKKKRFTFYSLYAWGSPLIISFITIAIENLPDKYKKHIPSPGIGVQSCFFKTNLGKMLYFHAPVSILLAANIIFFLLSSWSLVFGVWAPSANDKIKRQTKQRFLVVVELFFVMGLTWIAEIASWAISWYVGTRNVWSTSIVFDIANALQGFIIFLIVVMKSRIIRSIKRFLMGLPSGTSLQNSIRRLTASALSRRTGSKTTNLSSQVSGKTTNLTNLSSQLNRGKQQSTDVVVVKNSTETSVTTSMNAADNAAKHANNN